MLNLVNINFSYLKQGPSVLTDVTLHLTPGIHLLLGENGAGKSTLLRLIAGLIIPRTGTATLHHLPIPARTPACMRQSFFLPDGLEPPFTNIAQMQHRHAPFYPRFSPELLTKGLRTFHIDPHLPFKQMSIGTRHKALLAYALALRTQLLLLDEPTNTLDIDSKKALRTHIARTLPEDTILIIATHNVHDLLPLYDALIILRQGHIQLAATAAEITDTLAFISSPAPIPEAVYTELNAAQYRAIIPATPTLQTDPDYPLLYTAMATPAAAKIIQHLHNTRHAQH